MIITTHSADLLSDPGIDAREVFLLRPSKDGTEVVKASSVDEIKALLSEGMSLADVVLQRTEPREIQQLNLFEDSQTDSN